MLSVELALDFTEATCACAIAFSTALASSSGMLGLRFRLLRLELAWLPGCDVGFDGVRPLILFGLVLGALGPSRGVPGPLVRYCVDRESWLRRRVLGSRSNEFWREGT